MGVTPSLSGTAGAAYVPYSVMEPTPAGVPGSDTWVADVDQQPSGPWATVPPLAADYGSANPLAQWRTPGTGGGPLVSVAPQVSYTTPDGEVNKVKTLCLGLTTAPGTRAGARWLLKVLSIVDPVAVSGPLMSWDHFVSAADALNWQVDVDVSGTALDITWLGLGATPTVLYVSAALAYDRDNPPTCHGIQISLFDFDVEQLTTSAGLQYVKVSGSGICEPGTLQGAQNVACTLLPSGAYQVSWTLPPLLPVLVKQWTVRNLSPAHTPSSVDNAVVPVATSQGLVTAAPTVLLGTPATCGGCAPVPFITASPLPGSPAP